MELLHSLCETHERMVAIKAEGVVLLTTYLSRLVEAERSKMIGPKAQELVACTFLIELQSSDGLSDTDRALLARAEQDLFGSTSARRDHLATVLSVLHSKAAAPSLVIRELRKRFGTVWGSGTDHAAGQARAPPDEMAPETATDGVAERAQ